MIRLFFVLLVCVAGFAVVAVWAVSGEVAAVVERAIPEPVRAALTADAREPGPELAAAVPPAPAPTRKRGVDSASPTGGGEAAPPAEQPVVAESPPLVVQEIEPRADFVRDTGAPVAAHAGSAEPFAIREADAEADAGLAPSGPATPADLDDSADLVRRMLSVYRGGAAR